MISVKVEVFEELIGVTLISAKHVGDSIVLESETHTFDFHHDQDCCESVDVEDVCGDLDDLVGSPLIVAEEVDSLPDMPENPQGESFTWTFYRFATQKGGVTVRFLGTSNGYYSEGVDLHITDKATGKVRNLGYE